MRVEPVERQPLYHFHPGIRLLRPGLLSPSSVVTEAHRSGAHGVALPANPGPHVSRVLDAARACRQRGLFAAGAITLQAASEGRGVGLGALDAAIVDLTSAMQESWLRVALDRLADVFDRATMWIELVVHVIPGQTDSHRSIDQTSRWIGAALGPDVPVHFDGPAGELEALSYARWIAISNGLHWVYVDHPFDARGRSSWCPGCDGRLVVRGDASTSSSGLQGAACASCGWRVPGRFETETVLSMPATA